MQFQGNNWPTHGKWTVELFLLFMFYKEKQNRKFILA